MAKSSFTRREFLKISALSSSAVALGACASLDRMFLGDKRDLQNEVVILGAGAAGLAAAYSLKKKKVPFRLFEASSRVGGRVQSIAAFPEGGAIAELGAEFFEDGHESIFTLAKDLSLEVSEIKTSAGLEPQYFSFDGKIYRSHDLIPKMKTLASPLRRVREDLFRRQGAQLTYKNAQQFERSKFYDSLSLKDLLNSWRGEAVDPLVLKLIEAQAVARFGVDADEQSSLHFLETLDAEGSSLLAGRRTYRMNGGLGNLMNTLYSRVSGVIPDYVVKTNHALVEISEKKEIFELVFQTAQGRETYTTRNVICTLPFSKLREVNGISNLEGFSPLKKEAIANQGYATHSKGILTFTETFWRKKAAKISANLGNFTGDFLTQKFWDSGRGQEVKQGLLTYQRSGKSGESAGASAAQEALKDLSLFYPDLTFNNDLQGPFANWKQKKWAQGSMAYYKKNQFMRYKGVAGEPEYAGHFLFAGEHTSLGFAGTLQGALQSGLTAAAQISGL